MHERYTNTITVANTVELSIKEMYSGPQMITFLRFQTSEKRTPPKNCWSQGKAFFTIIEVPWYIRHSYLTFPSKINKQILYKGSTVESPYKETSDVRNQHCPLTVVPAKLDRDVCKTTSKMGTPF